MTSNTARVGAEVVPRWPPQQASARHRSGGDATLAKHRGSAGDDHHGRLLSCPSWDGRIVTQPLSPCASHGGCAFGTP